jgi:hypothetical protein
VISCLASAKSRLDSVSERTVSAGWYMMPLVMLKYRRQLERTLVITPRISPNPKNSLLCTSKTLEGTAERLLGTLDRRRKWPAMALSLRRTRVPYERTMACCVVRRMFPRVLRPKAAR